MLYTNLCAVQRELTDTEKREGELVREKGPVYRCAGSRAEDNIGTSDTARWKASKRRRRPENGRDRPHLYVSAGNPEGRTGQQCRCRYGQDSEDNPEHPTVQAINSDNLTTTDSYRPQTPSVSQAQPAVPGFHRFGLRDFHLGTQPRLEREDHNQEDQVFIRQLLAERISIKNENGSLRDENYSIRAQLSTVEDERDSSREEANSLRQDRHRLRDENHILQGENHSLEERYDSLQERLNNAEAERDISREVANSLREQLNNVKAERDRERDRKSLRDERDDLPKRRSNIKVERDNPREVLGDRYNLRGDRYIPRENRHEPEVQFMEGQRDPDDSERTRPRIRPHCYSRPEPTAQTSHHWTYRTTGDDDVTRQMAYHTLLQENQGLKEKYADLENQVLQQQTGQRIPHSERLRGSEDRGFSRVRRS